MLIPLLILVTITAFGFGLGLTIKFIVYGSVNNYDPGDFKSNKLIALSTLSFNAIGNILAGAYTLIRSKPLDIRKFVFERTSTK